MVWQAPQIHGKHTLSNFIVLIMLKYKLL